YRIFDNYWVLVRVDNLYSNRERCQAQSCLDSSICFCKISQFLRKSGSCNIFLTSAISLMVGLRVFVLSWNDLGFLENLRIKTHFFKSPSYGVSNKLGF